jgi:hypothetical protein
MTDKKPYDSPTMRELITKAFAPIPRVRLEMAVPVRATVACGIMTLEFLDEDEAEA